jgi:hypothetical protein
MTSKTKTGLAVVIAGFLASLLLFGAAPGRNSADAKADWIQQAEQTFYLSPGMGEKLISRDQWDRLRVKMKNMTPEQLSSFRLETHKSLMNEAHNRHNIAEGLVPDRRIERDVSFRMGGSPVFTLIANGSTADAACVSGGATGLTVTPGTGSLAAGTGVFESRTSTASPRTSNSGFGGNTMAATSGELGPFQDMSSDGSSFGAPLRRNRVVTSKDADTMFPSGQEYSTRRSVGEFDESRGAIFHRDFDVGVGDSDRNYW